MTIEETLQQYVGGELLMSRSTEIGLDQSLISSGLLDSLTLLQLIAFIEETYSITVDDTEMSPDNFQTINKMSQFIQTKLQANL